MYCRKFTRHLQKKEKETTGKQIFRNCFGIIKPFTVLPRSFEYCSWFIFFTSSCLSFLLIPHLSNAETLPKLSGYYSEISPKIIDSSYFPRYLSTLTGAADLNGDGNQDMVLLGADYPFEGIGNNSPQPGRVLLGDGNGDFIVAPNEDFPVETLLTVHPRKILTADFNGDGQADMFVSCHGWDTDPFPGEQNKLFLSKPGGGWQDATANLPQLNDFSHTAALGDINGDGSLDIFVGNGYGGQNQILSYILLNDGTGHFSVHHENIPVGSGESLDFKTWHMFPGATLADLDGDNLPELMITADSSESDNSLTQNVIFWNKSASFSESDKTVLPLPPVFAGSHIDLDIQPIEINNDGLLDLVVIGTQGQPFYDGWFVQVLINKGNKQFVDETTARIAPQDMFGGTTGMVTETPWPIWLTVLDFNHDGLLDFAVEFNPVAGGFKQNHPFVWINDKEGHFTTLKTGDLVAPGEEWRVGNLHLTPTRYGYSFFTMQYYEGSGGLVMTGLLASKPYSDQKFVNITSLLMLLLNRQDNLIEE